MLKKPTSVLLISSSKSSGVPGRVVPPRPHQHSHLVGRIVQDCARGTRLDVYRERLRCAVALLVSRQRNRNPVVLALAKRAALLLANADDGVRRAIDAQLLPKGIDPREIDGPECPFQ